MNDYSMEKLLNSIQTFIDENYGGNKAAAAKDWGIPNDNLHKWLRRERSPKLEHIFPAIMAMAQKKSGDITMEELDEISSLSSMFEPKKTTSRTEGLEPNRESYHVPVFDPFDGPPSGDMRPSFYFDVPKRYYQRADFAILVDGNAMFPTIPHHSIVGVTRDKARFTTGEIYAINYPHLGCVIRRVVFDPNTDRLVFQSDNPDKNLHPNYCKPVAEAQAMFIGKVVWSMGKV